MTADPRAAVVDLDEYGEPVREEHKRLGAGATREDETGLYVRFEPGFGLNVHIGIRSARYKQGRRAYLGDKPDHYEDEEKLVVGIGGWERLGELVDEWRARNA
jgi:hypothetical protein